MNLIITNMKPIVEMTQLEIKHRVKFFPVYQIGSYVLFVLMIYFAFLWSVEKHATANCEEMVKIQDSCFIDVLEHNAEAYQEKELQKECGVKFSVKENE